MKKTQKLTLTESKESLLPLRKIAQEWDANVEARALELETHLDKTYYEITTPLFLRLLEEEKMGKNILDIGCGLGFFAKEMFNKGYRVTGIDISKKSIVYATHRFPEIKFIHTSISKYSKGHQDCYDVCVANMVFQNMPNLQANLQAIYNMLEENGCLLISIPHPCIWFQTRQFANEFTFNYLTENTYKIPFHIRNGNIHPSPITYIHRPLEAYFLSLRKCGFNIISLVEPKNIIPNPPTDLLFWVCYK